MSAETPKEHMLFDITTAYMTNMNQLICIDWEST